MNKCNCSITTSVLGDGCEICNPEYYIDMLKDEVKDLEEANKELLSALHDLSSAAEASIKQGMVTQGLARYLAESRAVIAKHEVSE